MHFFHTNLLCSIRINTTTKLVFGCLCHWAAPLKQLLKGSLTIVEERKQSVSHSLSVLSEDWDPADQSHKQITINKLDGEPQRLGVLKNNDERQAFKNELHISKHHGEKEKTLNIKQCPIKCSIQPSAPLIYSLSGLRRPLFTESVYHTCALLLTGEMLQVFQ